MTEHSKKKDNYIIIGAIIIVVLIVSVCFYISHDKNKDKASIMINEYLVDNSTTLYDSDADTPDWIEIYNYGQDSVWLGDIYVSDCSEEPLKCLLPDRFIDAGEYLIIFASGKENKENEIHVSFKLGNNDNCIVLSYDENNTIDMCTIENLPTDISSGLNEQDEWRYYAEPTPNYKNNTPESETSDIIPKETELKSIIINEYMSNNEHMLMDEIGINVDWIELYNPNNKAVWIGDLYISDSHQKSKKYLLPDYEMKPNEYLLLYADHQISFSTDTEIYIPFSLSAGEQIILSNYNGKIIDTIKIESLPCDISAGLKENVWGYFAEATPGKENTSPISSSIDIEPYRPVDSIIYINEVMTNNKYSIVDVFGDTSDWIELYNPNNYDIALDGYGLSDDENDRLKWTFSKGTVIKAREYLLVFASGNYLSDTNNELHTNFSLGENDEKLFLSQPNYALVDSMDITIMPGNVSKGRLESEKYGYFSVPTPWRKNDGNCTETINNNSSIVLHDVYISEVAASQIKFSRSAGYALSEYIEIHNKSNMEINLEGYSITDSSREPWIFPDVIIKPDEYIVLVLKGNKDKHFHCIDADLSVSAAGEELTFRNNEGLIIDYYSTGYLPGEYSSGRQLHTGSQRYFFSEKTPGKENVVSTTMQYSQKPYLSHNGGLVDEESFLLEITAEKDCIIRYTLDGSKPDENSEEYINELLIDEDTVVRAVVFEENKLPSAAATATYIFSREHTLPIFCLSTDPYNLFSSTCGIYDEGKGPEKGPFPYYFANYWEDWECPVGVEFYENNGDLALAFDAGIQIAGQTSRALPQKSLIIRVREEYGVNEIYYPLFEDNEVKEFRHILLRTSGQDWAYTKIRDYYFHQSIKGYTCLDIMDGRPAAVYINGEYWGIYNIREKINEDYLVSHHGVDVDNLTIIESNSTVKSGDSRDWFDLKDFCKNNDFSDDLIYAQLESRLDVDAFIDYAIVETFYCNFDNGNIKYWRESSEGGKWRPLLYDLDASINAYNYSYNRIEYYFTEGNVSNIFYALRQNEKFCKKFVERYAYFLNEVFIEENISSDIDNIIDEISLEMQYHIKRWGLPSSYDRWEEDVLTLKENVINRRYYVVGHLAVEFNLDSAEINELFPWYEE